MTDDEKLMQQALEALEFEASGWEDPPPITREAITALRERLAQPAQQPRQWQGLTDEILLSLWSGDTPRPVLGKNKVLAFARAIEAAHDIKGEQHG